MKNPWQAEILLFWFGELRPEQWYESTPELDQAIRERFLASHEALATDLPPETLHEPDAALAAIIALDQFPRNMFRGTARAFASDNQAALLSRKAVEKELDAQVPPERRQFFYMPLEHSEVMADQEHSVMLFTALGDAENLRYAVEHRDIIGRFGRFPHRNHVLERESTPAEKAFLAEHMGFGQ
ncbi:MAG: DUF924 domain-containing protein [Methylobacterium mesophilicum]|nr:DUF924 domain-containing protein [Methylobacterium mesophilicum]